MDAFGASDPTDSQATQLLQELLEHESSPSKPSEARNSALKTQLHHSNEISSDSLPSSRTPHSLPQYHFHGLAEEVNEGSQKENIGAAKSSKDLGRSNPSPRPSSPHASSSRNVRQRHCPWSTDTSKKTNVTFQSPLPKGGASGIPNKPTTRQSPYKPTLQTSTRYKPPPRPPSRTSSQDSFACDPENNEELFLAKSEQFAVPLSELGKGSSPVRDLDATGGTSGSSMYAPYSKTSRQPVSLSPPRGRVLVEATPSNSSGSQSQSQDDHRSVSQRMEETQFGSGYESSEPSSSVFRFYANRGPEPAPAPVLEATQPSTQPEDSHLPEASTGRNPLSAVPSVIQSGPAAASASNPSGPRSLLSLVRPENRWRYRELGNALNAVPPAQSSNRQVDEPIPETQPSFPEAPPPRRGFPSKSSTVPSAPSAHAPSLVPVDFMEVKGAAAPSKPVLARTPVAASVQAGKKPIWTQYPRLRRRRREDVPLAVVAHRRRGRPPGRKNANKGKGKAVREVTKVPPIAQGKRQPQHSTAMAGRSWETGEVPSSVPEQDVVKDLRSTRARPAITHETRKDAVQKVPQSRQNSRSTSVAPKSHLQQEAEAGEDSEDEILTRREDKDDDTEPADEEYQDADEEDDAGPSRKRKRTSRAKRAAATPATRQQLKSLRSAASTGVRGIDAQGTRVFALWTQDGHYYPGIVHSADSNSRYNVKFDDGTDGWVEIEDMRLCELHVVKPDDKIQEKSIRDLRIAHKTILYAWTDRTLTQQTVSTTVKPVRKQLTPSPSKMSMVGMPSVRGKSKKVLAKTALIVTLMMNAVKHTGGFLIDDLTTIIKTEGKHAAQGNRWTINKSDVQWIGKDDIGRLFLLADDPNQKPKFLMALALGIPVLDSGEEKDWAAYMLPQGYSSALRARPSQQVDVDWGNSIHQLKDIMNNSVACKLFDNKSILCVGPDMVCPPKGKRAKAGVDERAQEASNAVPRIILAMGAEVVEAVTEPSYASKELSDYDYLIIREPHQYLPEFAQCVTVHWTWVKESLIASRYLPLPSWPTAEYSQEA
ncbi:hypothetical protein BDZ97DRAFT_1812840 [Flammula alnicola]|nr:hypothetical protein BDZ97DRAFT_1812840 [Flammula alnicola]